MAFFDFFRQKDENGVKRRTADGRAPLPEKPRFEKPAEGQPMQIRHPRSYADVEEIIDRMKDKLTVIVYLNELSAATAQRVRDILSGAVYALGGGMAELEKDMYVFTPDGVNAQ